MGQALHLPDLHLNLMCQFLCCEEFRRQCNFSCKDPLWLFNFPCWSPCSCSPDFRYIWFFALLHFPLSQWSFTFVFLVIATCKYLLLSYMYYLFNSFVPLIILFTILSGRNAFQKESHWGVILVWVSLKRHIILRELDTKKYHPWFPTPTPTPPH